MIQIAGRAISSRTVLLSIVLLFVFVNLLLAANGKITGRVVDAETGEPLVGANIVITHVIVGDGREIALDHPLGASADRDGYYFVLNVSPGVYVVRASMLGYTPTVQRPVRVESDRTVSLDFRLSSTVLEMETIVITAPRAQIRADVSATQEVIATRRIEEAPVIRVDEFVNKLKGVQLVSTADGQGLSVRGGQIRETDVRLDGISLQDPRTENAYLGVNSTTIQEMQVLTGGFEAKYGGIRSGLLNVITKEGNRDRVTFAVKMDYTSADQPRFFGTDPWSTDSWMYRVYAGEYAMNGVPAGDTTVPVEFRNFRGWKARGYPTGTPVTFFSPDQKLDLWKRQHPLYAYGDKPDIYFEGSMTGPVPFAERSTFLLGFKYEDTQLAYPLGPRNSYIDWNTQLKLSTALSTSMKLAINAMYADVSTVSGGQSTSYGGALVDQSSSFGFLSSNEASVNQQARLLAGSNLWQVYNKSRLQYYDQRYLVGGAKFTHTFASNGFYVLDLQFGYTDQQLQPFAMDTSRSDAWITYVDTLGRVIRFLNSPELGSPNASTNPGTDVLNMFRTYGGLQRVDSSESWVVQLKGDMTLQLGRHNQIEAGISGRMQNLFVYTGTWLQAQLAYTPDLWQYYEATPLEISLYAQDKLEFEGMIMNAGLRMDYYNPMKEGFEVSHPLDEDYRKFYNEVYQNLPGPWGGYERWEEFRSMLESPPGWPRTENRVQVVFSPRLGVSFPITESSKMYFNYGHFYQRPAVSFMYNQITDQGAVTVPSPDLTLGKTISYEFGYEQLFFSELLVNLTAYYKDIRSEPLLRTYVNYYHDNLVRRYYPDAYGDVRGIEVRLERPIGRFFTFFGMFDYMLQSYGQSGLQYVYENRLEARDELRTANISTTQPRPRGNISLNLHTPEDWGPEWLGVYWFEKIYTTFFFEWRDGGEILWNPNEPDIKNHIYVPVVDYWNIDFRGSKTFDMSFGQLEFVVTIKNLTNNKWLRPENMLQSQYDAYKASLRLPHQGGTDKWGQWKSDDGHINTGWWEAPIFLNPRRIILGIRMNV